MSSSSSPLEQQQQQQQQEPPKDNDDAIPPVPEGWTRCHVYIKQKHRYCRQHALRDSLYCGNHQEHHDKQQQLQQQEKTPDTTTTTTETSNNNNPRRLRVPCPLDPSHTVFAHRVAQHVPKCPAAKQQRTAAQAAYYRHGVNTGGHGELFLSSLQQQDNAIAGKSSKTKEQQVAWALRVARAVVQIHQAIFRQNDNNDNDTTTTTATTTTTDSNNINTISLLDIQNALALEDLSAPELHAGVLPNAISRHRIKSGGPKHVHQQASLVGHLRRLGVLPLAAIRNDKNNNGDDSNLDITTEEKSSEARNTKKARTAPVTIFEMGAGRGMLGLVAGGVSAVTRPTKLVLMERSGARSKADTVLRNLTPHEQSSSSRSCYMNLHALQWSRITCDLAHVHMPTVLQQEQVDGADANEMHVIAKHLCGVGTDLALKALEPCKDQVATCLLATCCHGVCNWSDYVGRDYLQALFVQQGVSFGHNEFELLRRWSSGSVMPTNDNDGNNEGEDEEGADDHPSAVPDSSAAAAADKDDDDDDDARSPVAIGRIVSALGLACGARGLGRCCQRLIDQGRREYMQHVLFADCPDAVTDLVHYVAPDVTPQNAILVGRRRLPATHP